MWHSAGMPLRRSVSPALVLVLAGAGGLLTGFGGTAAYLSVSSYLAEPSAPPGDGGGTDGGATDPSSPDPTGGAPAAAPCPQATIDAVRRAGEPGDLVIVAYARGRVVQGGQIGLEGEAWICQDSDGDLYYQGHDLTGDPPGPSNTILLGQGIDGQLAPDGSAYVATRANGGTYRVDCGQRDLRTSGGTVWQVDCTIGAGPATFSPDDTG